MASIVYIAREIERALGKQPGPGYHIVTNATSYSEKIRRVFPDHVTLIASSAGATGTTLLDTAELMERRETQELVNKLGGDVLVFKNNPHIETIAKRNNWPLLNSSASLAEKIENKITQVEWLGEVGEKYLAEHQVIPVKDIIWKKEPFIIQWAHSHTGDGTILINSNNELYALKTKFPEREARVTAYVYGPSFTVNVVVTGDKIFMGNVSYQITGLPPFTDNAFTTVGNDWSATHSLLSENEIQAMEIMVQEIGAKMQTAGWKGLFGIDLIRDDNRDRIFLIEINARQPASTSFESILQETFRVQGVDGMTVFEAHLAALQNKPITLPPIPLNDGAQIVQRVTKKVPEFLADTESGATQKIAVLESAGYTVIPYPNVEYNADLLRIQSLRGIIETHGTFNARGKYIVDTLHGN